MSRDYQRPGNVANLVETHPEFSLVGREMIFRNCIDRTTITHFHLQDVSPHRVIEQLAFSAPLTQFMFLYVNNSQVYLLSQSPQHCIICSCVCNASAWWNGFWLLQSMTDSPSGFSSTQFPSLCWQKAFVLCILCLKVNSAPSIYVLSAHCYPIWWFTSTTFPKISSHTFLLYQVHLLDSTAQTYMLFYRIMTSPHSVLPAPLASFTSDQ